MKMKAFRTISLVCIGLVLGVVLTARMTAAQFVSPPDSHGVMYLANHHSELNFNLAPGQSRSFQLPKKNCPVRVEVSTSTIDVLATDGSTLSRPVLLTTTVSVDGQNGLFAGFGFNDHTNEPVCPNGGGFGCALVAIEPAPNGALTIRESTTAGGQITNSPTAICVSLWY